jgi:hypothetical protein
MDVLVNNSFNQSKYPENRGTEIYIDEYSGTTRNRRLPVDAGDDSQEYELGENESLAISKGHSPKDVDRRIFYKNDFDGHIGFRYEDGSEPPNPWFLTDKWRTLMVPAGKPGWTLEITKGRHPKPLPKPEQKINIEPFHNHGNVQIGDDH